MLLQQLVSTGHACEYRKFTGVSVPNELDQYDAIFICGSIVCYETECKLIGAIRCVSDIPIFYCGTFPRHVNMPKFTNSIILSGNYEFSDPEDFSSPDRVLAMIRAGGMIDIPATDRRLFPVAWGENGLPIPKNLFLGGIRPFIPYIFNRGCPYSCSYYCTYPTTQGKKVVSVPITNAIADLKFIDNKFPGAHVVFRDPVFSINVKNSKLLLKEIIDADLSLQFSVELHLKNLDDEFLDLAKQAKVSAIKFGIESAHEYVRVNSKRISLKNDEQFQIISKIRDRGIRSVGMFILGQPNDTHKSCSETIDYACKLGLDIAQFSVFTAYTGTEYYIKNPGIKVIKFENLTQFHPVLSHDNLTDSDVRELLQIAYKRFITAKIIKKIRFWHSC